MRQVRYISIPILLCLLLSGASAAQQKPSPSTQPKPSASPSAVNADAATLADFKQRLTKYIELQKDLADDSPPLKETSDPAKIDGAQEVLGAKIRAARMDAKPGDIFTPEARALFRRLMYPELKGEDGPETKASIAGHDKPPAVPLKVNAKYPESAPLPTVPPNLLARLPQLPEDVEYRIVGKDLILRDVDANIIVDFIPNAIR
ncbi:MAG TPA: hypothetical protein VHJ58_18960 [Vicinamibacterales bacterium]|nr:hypothetical protein [Vicinamibacterales bacterium]